MDFKDKVVVITGGATASVCVPLKCSEKREPMSASLTFPRAAIM